MIYRCLMAVTAASVLLLSACTSQQTEIDPNFRHDLDEGRHPWLHENFDTAPEKFTFGIIGDLNGGEREGIFDIAVEQLNLLRPEFVISVGDLIDGPSQEREALQAEWDVFDQRASGLTAPFFHVGGNHDLTGMPLRYFWEERFGARYYWFRYHDALFLVLDSEDHSPEKMDDMMAARNEAIRLVDAGEEEAFRNSRYMAMEERRTGWISEEQVAYFSQVLEANKDVRWTFLFLHKPAWLREGEKPLDQLEAALSDRPYTWFNGHFHAYDHTVRHGRDYIMLGTTGGYQDPKKTSAFDHITLVTVGDGEPSIAQIRLDGILNKAGEIPLDGSERCFQASACAPAE
jgi:hypothetical protein